MCVRYIIFFMDLSFIYSDNLYNVYNYVIIQQYIYLKIFDSIWSKLGHTIITDRIFKRKINNILLE